MSESEFIPAKPERFILAKNQCLSYYPDIEKMRSIDQYGNQKEVREFPTGAKIQSVYWSKQYKLVSMIGIVSSGVLFMVLFQNTGIGALIFQTIANTVGYLGSLILNPIMGAMPHL